MKGESPLRKLRKSRGWTQDQLAALSGIDQTTISRLETDAEPNPTPETHEALAKALGIAPSNLQFTAPEPSEKVSKSSDRVGPSRREKSALATVGGR